MKARYGGGPVPPHIWLGVSVEDAAHVSRIDHLKSVNSEARFISFEPLLGPIDKVDRPLLRRRNSAKFNRRL
ncbi:DUF5131 family protein [Roseicyclus amphidinii]|uniref:DUF5131 family protein n=1 Tax=Roseicyclus amphidinii TaxID=3034232 RepID=UPI0024E12E65|nr:DUF5131 family protein [Roseicyclus sp. Amp-Y-6]